MSTVYAAASIHIIHKEPIYVNYSHFNAGKEYKS